jgi:hypothetical protein
MFALVVVGLAAALITVRRVVLTEKPIHDIEVRWTEGGGAVAVFWEVA